MSSLTIISQVRAYDDVTATSNPTRRLADWSRTLSNLPVDNASTQKLTIGALSTATIVDGTRATSIDGTSAFSLTLNSQISSRYRLTSTGGTVPAFRVARSVPLAGIATSLTLNANLSMTVTAATGTPFSAVAVGDVAFLRGILTGDSATLFSSLNTGYWTVIGASSTAITMTRAAGEVFSGLGEIVTPASNADFQIFSTTGIQVGDMVEISAGFAASTLRAYEVAAVTPSWIEVVSTTALALETGIIPGATGLLFYSAAKRFILLEVDQEVAVRLNGDTGNTNRLQPWLGSNLSLPAQFMKVGPVWKLDIVNRSTVPVTVLFVSAE